MAACAVLSLVVPYHNGIGGEGRDWFYEGAVERSVVATLRAKGGVHELDNFAAHEGGQATNAQLVERAVAIVSLLGEDVANAADTRSIPGLNGKGELR